jgi:hypothetical protein
MSSPNTPLPRKPIGTTYTLFGFSAGTAAAAGVGAGAADFAPACPLVPAGIEGFDAGGAAGFEAGGAAGFAVGVVPGFAAGFDCFPLGGVAGAF